MKKYKVVILCLTLFVSCSRWSKEVEFTKSVSFNFSSYKELEGYTLKHNIYTNNPVWISKEGIISEKQIKKMVLKRVKRTKEVYLYITLKDEYIDMFYNFTKDNINKDLSIVSEDKVLQTARIVEGISGGEIALSGAFYLVEE